MQQTLIHPIIFQGVGVHSGHSVTMKVCPAGINTGIVFVRSDLPDHPPIAAKWHHVCDTRFCTHLQNNDGARVSTVEHILAALWMRQIDNAIIHLDGPEVPIMDGSAAIYLSHIQQSHIQIQSVPRRHIKVLKRVQVTEDAHRFAILEPADQFSISYQMDFKDRAGMAEQSFHFQGPIPDFEQQVGRARTYGFLEDVEKLKTMNLARGGSLENAVVIDCGRPVNPTGWRMPNECVRHKALDVLGDLYLAGAPIQGAYTSRNGGHGLNNQLLRALFADDQAWTWS